MPKGYKSQRFNASEMRSTDGIAGARSIASAEGAVAPDLQNDSLKSATFYLARLLENSAEPTLRALASELSPQTPDGTVLRDFVALDPEATPSYGTIGTHFVQFQQTLSGVSVFGSKATVELDSTNEFVSASVSLVDVAGVAVEPQMDQQDAQLALANALGVEQVAPKEVELTIFTMPSDGEKHLAWHFTSVQAPPATEQDLPPRLVESTGPCDVGSDHKLQQSNFDYDYFVDAKDGGLLYFFSNSVHAVPTWCRGLDEDNTNQSFYGRSTGPGFEMANDFEDISTHDLNLQRIEHQPVIGNPVSSVSNDWSNNNTAAVSAHVNAARVMDFLFSVLRRNSIDDKGLPLVSLVNCTSRDTPSQNQPEWVNAAWWQGKMWYGQKRLSNGSFRSLAGYLDIIAHELVHGVTEHTAKLVYRDFPGALNESVSDIFGVIIRNWFLASEREDFHTWDWEIGSGLGAGGGPMRHFAQPSSTGRWHKPVHGQWVAQNGYPDHMNQHVSLPPQYDSGGVHIWSNIHNKAAFTLMTSTKSDASFLFLPQEIAVLYYLALGRLGRMSDFSDARSEVLSVARVMYGGTTARSQEVETAISSAYDSVGIF